MKMIPESSSLPAALPDAFLRGWEDDIILFNSLDPRSRGLEATVDPTRSIYITRGLDGERVISTALTLGFQHIVQAEPETFESEVRAAAQMIQSSGAFLQDPLLTALGAIDGGRYAFSFTLSAQKKAALDSLGLYLDQLPGTATVRESLLRIGDEMFTNAIYNAPTDDSARFRHADSLRTREVGLAENEYASLVAACNRDWIAIACLDSFGSLELDKLLRRIRECYDRGLSRAIRVSGGGAGIGCYTMFEISSALYVGVLPGKRTAVCCKLPLRRSFRKTDNISKNLHIEYHFKKTSKGAGMSPLQIHSASGESGVTIRIQGEIDEDSVFSEAVIQEGAETVLDLSGVTALNSCGIREWIRWMKSIPGSARLVFARCPKVVVDQMNMVDGFLPKGAAVSSFFVPYFCESCEKLSSVLFTEGKEVTQGAVAPPAQVLCDHCKKSVEMDVIESKYFKFLQAKRG